MSKRIVSGIYQKCLKWKFSNKLVQFKNCHQGERCFVIGNGPSLTAKDLDALRNEYTFAAHKIHKIFDRTLWRPTYYVINDDVVRSDISDDVIYDISRSCKNCFLTGGPYRNYSKEIKHADNVCFYSMFDGRRDDSENIIVSEDISKGISNVNTVTFTMLQIAMYMGFKEIYLLGVDNNFSKMEDDKGHVIIQNLRNHFEGGEYTQTGLPPKQWLLNLTFEATEKYAKKHGIKIYNATHGGKLEVFERVSFDELLRNIDRKEG